MSWEDNATIPISVGSRDIVSKMKSHNLLSMGTGDNDLNTKDIYLLAVALGLDNPNEQMVKPESWTRTNYFTIEDKSLIRAVLLGTASSTDQIADYCDIKKAFDYCKKLTDAGFQELDKIAADSKYFPDLMVRKILDYVDVMIDDVIYSNPE